MKITIVDTAPPWSFPPLTLQVLFETEDEMREFKTVIGPMKASGPFDCFYEPLRAHLEKYSLGGGRGK